MPLPTNPPTGYGFTSKYEEALQYGCIPVIIMDIVDPALSNVVDPTEVSSTRQGLELHGSEGSGRDCGSACRREREGEHWDSPHNVRLSATRPPPPPPNQLNSVVRIMRKDLERVPEILGGIPAEEVERLQRNIARHWHRFTYLSYPYFAAMAEGVMERNRLLPEGNQTSLPGRELELLDGTRADAVHTLMEWLHGRMDQGL